MSVNENNHRVRVLVVDDSRVVRVAASRMFGDEFDVLHGVDGADGLNIIERDPDIHVVFTDLAMPEMDGFELLESIRSHANENIRNLPVVVATGAGDVKSAKDKAFSLGATDFITKPFDAVDIKARARSYAQFRETNRELQEQITLDSLTGVLNTKGLIMQLEKELSFVTRHKSNIIAMSIEIDDYKDLFIRIGRLGAETLVKRVAGVLVKTFRKEDSIARTGLGRFFICMPFAKSKNAFEMADRVRQTIEGFKATLDGKRIKITVCIGLSVVESNYFFASENVIGMADEALYRAAQKGTNQLHELSFEHYKQKLYEDAKTSMSIDRLLEQIEGGNQLAITTQLDAAIEKLAPIFNLLSNEQKQRILLNRPSRPSNVIDFSSTRDN